MSLYKIQSPGNIALKSILSILALAFICSGALRWQWMNPRPQGNHLYDIMYNRGLFYAVGESGTIMTSSDGKTWKVSHISPFRLLLSIAFGNEQYVAVGYNGAILSSIDGNAWKVRTSDAKYSHNLNCVIYADGRFVAVGDSSFILTSKDGVSWHTARFGSKDRLHSVAYGKGHYVVSGSKEYSTGGSFVLTSTDGSEWTEHDTAGTPPIYILTFIDDTFSALTFDHRIFMSDDGVTWDLRETGVHSSVSALVKLDTQLIATGDGGLIMISSDGDTWTRQQSGTTMNFYGCAVGNGRAVAIGQAGVVVLSSDAVSWEMTSYAMNDTLNSIAYGNNRYVAVGQGHSVLTSPDGAIWSKNDTGNGLQRFTNLYSIVFVNDEPGGSGGHFLVAGSAGLATSADGTAWTAIPSPTGIYESLYSVCGNGNRLVAVGTRGTIVSSQDRGVSWTACTTGTTLTLQSVTYADDISGGQFIAVGYSGAVFTSSDGATWVRQNTNSYDKFYSIAFGNGRLVALRHRENAVGVIDSVQISSDGIHWEKTRITIVADLVSIVFGDEPEGKFVAAARNGTIYESTDGVTWSEPFSCSGSYFLGTGYVNNQFAVLGARTILFGTEDDSRSIAPPPRQRSCPGGIRIVNHRRSVTIRLTGADKIDGQPTAYLFTPGGRLILSEKTFDDIREPCFPIANLAAGVYLVKVVWSKGKSLSLPFLHTP